MASVHSDVARPTVARPVSAKVVVSGGFGVGKTTLVGAVSEITPLRTEAAMTTASSEVDDTSKVGAKTTTTVAMDFGKLTVEDGLVLYLFGTPGQDRFGFMWDDVVDGALGAVVLVDTRRLVDCYAAVDYFESRRMPFIVALNQFEGAPRHDIHEVREALDLADTVPIVMTDARSPWTVRDTLVSLLELVLARLSAPGETSSPPLQAPPPPPPPPIPAPAPSLTAEARDRALQAVERERG